MTVDEITFNQWVLKEQPGDDIDVYETFELKKVHLRAEPDKILVKTLYLSNDPAQRTWMSKHIQADRHYMKMIDVGDVMAAGAVVSVVNPGNNSEYKEGDLLSTFTGWTEYALITPQQIIAKVEIPPEDFLALGGTGLTAATGIFKVGTPKPTDKLMVISGAAGATGSIVCQIAKNVLGIKKVVGIAGSAEKCELLKTLGCDIALNYKSPNYESEFDEATEGYIDIYWDNVGGKTLDMAVSKMAQNGRVISCGAISGYNSMKEVVPAISMESYMKMIPLRVRIQAFIYFDYKEDIPGFQNDLKKWWLEGSVKPLKTVWETSFDKVPEGMMKLLKGENTGKLVTKLA